MNFLRSLNFIFRKNIYFSWERGRDIAANTLHTKAILVQIPQPSRKMGKLIRFQMSTLPNFYFSSRSLDGYIFPGFSDIIYPNAAGKDFIFKESIFENFEGFLRRHIYQRCLIILIKQ